MSTLSRWLTGPLIAVCVLFFAIIQLIPFYIALTTALKPRTDLSSQLVLPLDGLYLENFRLALEQGEILRAMGNSVIVTFFATVLVCLAGAMAAYPLARRPTFANRGLLAMTIGLMMVPPLSLLVPLYTVLSRIGALNTYWGIICVLAATGLPVGIFLYTSFMRTLPISLEEAATIDGAGRAQVLWYVLIPLLRPVTATVAILTGVGVWNEYALSNYILTDPARRTIAPAIASFFSMSTNNLPAAAAASLVAVLPVILAYLVLQKYFVQGLIGAEKG